MTTHRKPPFLEPKTQAFVDALAAQGGKPLYELSYAAARKLLEDAQAIKVATLPADVEDTILPTGPTGEVSVRIYRPKGAQGPLPVVMYFHGGGWILGSKNTHDRLLRDLVNGTHAAFVFVNYTPSPEAQFPVPTMPPPRTSRSTGPGSAWIPAGSRWRGTAWAATWSPS